uniref:Uncharacterized protein n=1 Tax=Meloidogyne enterolobii TaxID=390850 RepID=A0A6V7UQN5_MELEN|nr:unnamed protein product [Meloidogyne enterolobii]
MTELDTIPVFIFGMEQGGVYLFDPANKQLNKIFQADSGIRQILDMPQQNYFLAITEEMMFYQLMCDDKLVNDKIKVKLAAKSKYFQMIRVGFGTVAFAYGDREIRIWDLEAEDSAILRLRADRGYEASDEQVLMLSYLPKKDSICGMTSKWRLATWRRVQNNNLDENNTNIARSLIDQQWKLTSAISLNIQHVIGMAWSNNSAAFALNSGDSVQIFLSQCIEFFVDSNYAVIQVSAQLLNLVKITDPMETQELQLHSNIRGFFVTENYLTLWDDTKANQIHCPKDAPIKIENVASFEVNNIIQAAYFNQHIYTLANEQLLVRTLQGTIKRSITFREIEGKPEMINVKGSWFCVASSLGYIRIYDLSESSMKLIFRSSNLRNSIPTFFKWQQIRINSAGNRVCFTLRKDDDEQISSERVYVWEAENDSVGYFSFNSGITTNNNMSRILLLKIELEQSRFRLPLHAPGNFFWDQNDPRLLICEAISIGNNNDGFMPNPSYLLTMFVTAEHGIQMHDLQQKSAKTDALIFVSVPYIYFLKNIEADDEDEPGGIELSISRLVIRRTLREFIGIDVNDREAIQAMLDFSFYLCIGQMDNAFKAIKFIKNESVWEHMARMCVKTRRIDVARVCLGHMANARAARAIRRTIELKELPELQIARLAIELGMNEEAIRLFEKANRFDLVNQVYQAQGKWTEAFAVVEEHDRINLRHTHYNYAKQLESVGAFEKAIENYEKANTHYSDVPRMLCDEPKVLEFYTKKKAEPELYKWWAQFVESTGDMETAKSFYQNAKDFLSVIRILCHNGQFEEVSLEKNFCLQLGSYWIIPT